MLYEKEKPFNKNIFFSKLNTISLETCLKISEQYKKNLEIDTPLIKKITYQIIDMAFEGYLFQIKNEKELLDLPLFKEWNRKFVNGKPIKFIFIYYMII